MCGDGTGDGQAGSDGAGRAGVGAGNDEKGDDEGKARDSLRRVGRGKKSIPTVTTVLSSILWSFLYIPLWFASMCDCWELLISRIAYEHSSCSDCTKRYSDMSPKSWCQNIFLQVDNLTFVAVRLTSVRQRYSDIHCQSIFL